MASIINTIGRHIEKNTDIGEVQNTYMFNNHTTRSTTWECAAYLRTFMYARSDEYNCVFLECVVRFHKEEKIICKKTIFDIEEAVANAGDIAGECLVAFNKLLLENHAKLIKRETRFWHDKSMRFDFDVNEWVYVNPPPPKTEAKPGWHDTINCGNWFYRNLDNGTGLEVKYQRGKKYAWRHCTAENEGTDNGYCTARYEDPRDAMDAADDWLLKNPVAESMIGHNSRAQAA